MAGRTEPRWTMGQSPCFSAFKAGLLMENIFQLKQAWNHGELLKLVCSRGANCSCVSAFVYVTVSSIEIVLVNCYLTVECFVIMIEPGCTEAVFPFRFIYLSMETIIKPEWYIINS